MIFNWLNSLAPWRARRAALVYFNLACWPVAAIIVWGFYEICNY